MIAVVYNDMWVASALPLQCVFTWYRQEDQTVILVFVRVPDLPEWYDEFR
jgi:hypothetical protein